VPSIFTQLLGRDIETVWWKRRVASMFLSKHG